MSHYSYEQWMAYIRGTEIGRDSMDLHLSKCDACLETYMSALDSVSSELPSLTDVSAFAVKATEKVFPPNDAPKTASRLFSKPLFLYAVAASITLMLMQTGAFHQLFDQASYWSRQAEASASPVYSDEIAGKAGRWLDKVPRIITKKEGKR